MKKKILIVEDDNVMSYVCQRLLEKHDFETETASDGAKGLERLAVFRPDAVLLDLMMPKVNGIEFIKGVRNHEAFKDLPIIVLTNVAVPMLVEQATQAGATRVLDKSKFNPVALIEHLRALLNTGPTTTSIGLSQAQPWKG